MFTGKHNNDTIHSPLKQLVAKLSMDAVPKVFTPDQMTSRQFDRWKQVFRTETL